ncbi:MAG: cupin domain-containing protein [Actinomycetota bacterium]
MQRIIRDRAKGGAMGDADPVVRISKEERRVGAPTAGIQREEAVATETTWGGFMRTDAGMISGWHHHGEYESVIYVLTGSLRMESGSGGSSVVDAGPGDFLFVPRGAIHRESNPADVELTAVVVRSGSGDPVMNVDGPA